MHLSLRSIHQSLFEAERSLEINVFDFDDTLVRTSSYVHVTNAAGESKSLTPAEYAVYEKKRGDVFDFSDFDILKSPEPISHMLLKLKYSIRNLGIDNVFILTARGVPEPVQNFLDGMGISGIRVIALGNGDPAAKAEVIKDEILRRKVRLVKFFDDSPKNVVAVRRLNHDPQLRNNVKVLSVRIK